MKTIPEIDDVSMTKMVLISGFDLKTKETEHISIQFPRKFSLA